MSQVAVFVDAGYFFAQGSTALTGSKKERRHATLDRQSLLAALRSVAQQKSGLERLLRIYWYDGLPRGGPTLQQQNIASADNVKLRLGLINEYGQQKGVDSLIVTDLVDLSRNRAISDAVLLSGDEDVRIGVEIAQSMGVRVHLLGIVPSRGSQSRNLLSEADTTTEWSKDEIAAFLEFADDQVPDHEGESPAASPEPPEVDQESVFRRVVAELVEEMTDAEIGACRDSLHDSGVVPRDYDSKLLAISRTHLDRDLTIPERVRIRHVFRKKLTEASGGKPEEPVESTVSGEIAEAELAPVLDEHVDEYVRDLSPREIRDLMDYWCHSSGVPQEHDKILLASCRRRIGRDLMPNERRLLRGKFNKKVEERHPVS